MAAETLLYSQAPGDFDTISVADGVHAAELVVETTVDEVVVLLAETDEVVREAVDVVVDSALLVLLEVLVEAADVWALSLF